MNAGIKSWIGLRSHPRELLNCEAIVSVFYGANMTWRLDRSGQSAISIATGDLVLGSGERCDVRLSSAESRHALLRVVAGRLFLESIDDAPIWVNDKLQAKIS